VKTFICICEHLGPYNNFFFVKQPLEEGWCPNCSSSDEGKRDNLCALRLSLLATVTVPPDCTWWVGPNMLFNLSFKMKVEGAGFVNEKITFSLKYSEEVSGVLGIAEATYNRASCLHLFHFTVELNFLINNNVFEGNEQQRRSESSSFLDNHVT